MLNFSKKLSVGAITAFFVVFTAGCQMTGENGTIDGLSQANDATLQAAMIRLCSPLSEPAKMRLLTIAEQVKVRELCASYMSPTKPVGN